MKATSIVATSSQYWLGHQQSSPNLHLPSTFCYPIHTIQWEALDSDLTMATETLKRRQLIESSGTLDGCQ